MKEIKTKYYPNGCKKHVIEYHHNGCKWRSKYFDEDEHYHNENEPAWIDWYYSGRLEYISYRKHGKFHYPNNPSCRYYTKNSKMGGKFYYLDNERYSKLQWMNIIKNI